MGILIKCIIKIWNSEYIFGPVYCELETLNMEWSWPPATKLQTCNLTCYKLSQWQPQMGLQRPSEESFKMADRNWK